MSLADVGGTREDLLGTAISSVGNSQGTPFRIPRTAIAAKPSPNANTSMCGRKRGSSRAVSTMSLRPAISTKCG